jgi:hypothetical protein
MTDLIPHSGMQHALAFAQELAKAELLPKPYQRKPAMVLVAMEMAKDLGCSVVAVMNGTYEISGRLSFYTDFMLAQARKSGVIKSVSYETTGEGQTLSVTARAVLGTGEVVEATVGMKEAVAEGWTRNSKYRTSPEQMLRKRSMKRLISNYCPEVMLGSADDDEVDAQATDESSVPHAVQTLSARLQPAQVIEHVPEPQPEILVEAEEQTQEAPPSAPTVLKAPAPAKRQAAKPERVAQVLEENVQVFPEGTLTNPSVVGEAVPWTAGDKAHRALVTEVFNAKEIPARWRNTHREKLTAFLTGLSEDNLLRATLEDVTEAVERYVVENPPK